MPANLSFEQAATVPVSGMTALQAVRDRAQVQAGQKVLDIGASGGVGTFAVQLAKAFGAEVTVVCSTSKLDLFGLRCRLRQQYTSIAFTDALRHARIAPSIGTVGDALDNALMESSIGLYKNRVDRLRRSQLAERSRSRDGHCRVRPLVQPLPASQLDRHASAHRVRSLVPCAQDLPNRGGRLATSPHRIQGGSLRDGPARAIDGTAALALAAPCEA
jgi:hypothetical protein